MRVSLQNYLCITDSRHASSFGRGRRARKRPGASSQPARDLLVRQRRPRLCSRFRLSCGSRGKMVPARKCDERRVWDQHSLSQSSAREFLCCDVIVDTTKTYAQKSSGIAFANEQRYLEPLRCSLLKRFIVLHQGTILLACKMVHDGADACFGLWKALAPLTPNRCNGETYKRS